MQGMYSTRSPAVKRLMKEAQELREPTEQYHAHPLEDNLFEWHFTIRGPGETEFEDGIYHGRIILPPDYPMKPPSIILLTPNGRFETFKKICLSISGHHPESWQPSWSIRTALLAIIGFMPTHGGGAIGSLDYPSDERKRLAKRSLEWKCPTCGNVNDILKPVTAASKETAKEAKELASQINFQAEKQTGENKNEESKATASEAEPKSTIASTANSTPNPQTQFSFPAGQLPFQPGQPPFPNFGFPPPFMGMPNMSQQQQQSNMPPRFPPPPFIPGMFPPGFFQGVPFSGSTAMASWPGNPFMNPNLNKAFQQNSNQQGTSAAASQATSSAPQATGAASSVQNTEVSASQATSSASSTPNLSSPKSKVSSDSETGNTSSQNSSSPTPSTGASAAVSSQDTNVQSDNSQNEDNTRTSTPTSSSSENNLRQRLVQPERRTAPVGRVGQSAELPPQPQPQSSRFSVSSILILIIGLAILALLIRRFLNL